VPPTGGYEPTGNPLLSCDGRPGSTHVTMGDGPCWQRLSGPGDCVQHAGIARRLGEHGDPTPVDAGGSGAPGLRASGRHPARSRAPLSCPCGPERCPIPGPDGEQRSAASAPARKSHSKSQRRPASGDISRRRATVRAVQAPSEPALAELAANYESKWPARPRQTFYLRRCHTWMPESTHCTKMRPVARSTSRPTAARPGSQDPSQ
jgi:hypothetical protein